MSRAAAVRLGFAARGVRNELDTAHSHRKQSHVDPPVAANIFAAGLANLEHQSAETTAAEVRREQNTQVHELTRALRPAKKRTRTSATRTARKATNGPRRAPFRIPKYWDRVGRYHLTQKRNRVVYMTSSDHLVYRNNGKLVIVHPTDQKLQLLTTLKNKPKAFNLGEERARMEREKTERKASRARRRK